MLSKAMSWAPSHQALRASATTSQMARPAICVSREAEALPAFGVWLLSSQTISTFSIGSSSASAAIWRRIRCAPWPTSAAPMRTRACSYSARPNSSTVAVGQARHHELGGELRLGRAEAAERTAGHVVGVDRAAVERNVGDLVAATGEQRGDLDHFDAGRGIGAAIGDDLGLDGGDLTVPR